MYQGMTLLDTLTIPPLVPGKTPAETTVVVAMSGGVDSSCVAALCAKLGYQTIGVTLQLWDYQGGTDSAGKKLGTCCALDDVYDAKLVCKQIGIPHHVMQVEKDFKAAVIDDFVATYAAGATPIPCIRCNQRIKFKVLLTEAKRMGADVLVTGHYVRKTQYAGQPMLQMADAPNKDQSYYLFATTREELEFLEFPLGHVPSKGLTRQLAAELGLHLHQKPDSYDICFVPGGDYRKVVHKFAPETAQPGAIVLEDGTLVGQHDGIIGYTVGQRKGLGGGFTEPMFVVAVRPERQEVVIGPKSSLLQTTFYVQDVNWLGPEMFADMSADLSVIAKVRAQHAGAPALLQPVGNQRALVTFFAPEEQISPGQAAVFYTADNILLGGGWIEPPHGLANSADALPRLGSPRVRIQPTG